MVTIKRGNKVLKVTRGSYLNYFYDKGFRALEGYEAHEFSIKVNSQGDYENRESEDSTHLENDFEDDEENESQEFNLSEIPLSEMTLGQLYEYAEQLNVPTDGMRTRKELRAAIREYQKS